AEGFDHDEPGVGRRARIGLRSVRTTKAERKRKATPQVGAREVHGDAEREVPGVLRRVDPLPPLVEPREGFLRDVGPEARIARDERGRPRHTGEEVAETRIEITGGR